jgi:two-component system chemotaxis response regulator CheB
MTKSTIDVLLVSDSASLSQLMAGILSESCPFNLFTVSDPSVAMLRVAVKRPDVIVLDLDMQRSGALIFMRRIMADAPIPVIVCSDPKENASAGVRALQIGAVDIIAKPNDETSFDEWSAAVIDVVIAAAAAKPRRFHDLPATSAAPQAASLRPLSAVVIGAATGGVEAVSRLLQQFPANAPPTVVVQQMPQGFTGAFARRLDEICSVRVREAQAGDVLETGTALIVPPDRHAILVGAGSDGISIVLTDMQPVNRRRPSVDVLFHSAAAIAGSRAAGVLLTGSGRDGAAGLLVMRHAAALTIAQDEATSVAFGMPKAAIELGAATRVCALADMGRTILYLDQSADRRMPPGMPPDLRPSS